MAVLPLSHVVTCPFDVNFGSRKDLPEQEKGAKLTDVFVGVQFWF
jgi:hypothetical protein